MKPIIVSPHAFDRLEIREVTRQEVELTVDNPDWKETVKHGNIKYIRQFEGRRLHVVVKEKDRYFILVTLYWRRS